MPGEIDEESILENKPAIKNYWESKMKENAASQFARSNFGMPSTTIIDKINDEIREDYLRNLELMQDEGLPRSSASDTSDEPIEFDSFDMASSSNGSSPFGQPNHTSSPIMMSQSPTLIDSGHQSQESHVPTEDEHDSSQRGADSSIEGRETSPATTTNVPLSFTNNSKPYQGGSPIYKGYNSVPSSQSNKQQSPKYLSGRFAPTVGGLKLNAEIVEQEKVKQSNQQGKNDSPSTNYIAFNKPFAKTVKPVDEPTFEREKSPPKSPPVSAPTAETLEDKFRSLALKSSQSDLYLKSGGKADLSYMIATSRLKKEIEDTLQREKELKEQGRVKTLSVETVVPPAPAISLSIQSSDEVPAESQNTKVTSPPAEETVVQKPEEKKKASPPAQQVPQSGNSSTKVTKTVDVPSPPVAQKESSPVREKSPEMATTQQSQRQHQTIQEINPNFKIGKNFTSLERYIMYSSLTRFNIGKSIPPTPTSAPATSIQEEVNGSGSNNKSTNFDFENVGENGASNGAASNKKVSTKFAVNEEEVEKEEEEPMEKVRKNYIPTEKRIQNELEEMMQREEELKRSRQQWQSTPNLSQAIEEEEEEVEQTEQPAEVPVIRETPGRLVNEKRRRSALISKWEDMISKNNNNQ